MNIRERIARAIAPRLKSDSEVRAIVSDEIERARMASPISVNYDPKNEGYRRLSGGDARIRDLQPMAQDRMFEVAYFMWDSSAMMRRLAIMDRSFLFSGPFKITSPDEDVQGILDAFMSDNRMELKFPERAMWLSVLGEQVWPVWVNPHSGAVQITYEDPAEIAEVYVHPYNKEQVLRVDLRGPTGRDGRKMSVIWRNLDLASKKYGRLDGQCFFYRLNAPPNSPRGRSDYLTLFDWIDSLERYGFNYLERAEFMLNFVWDVMLKGMTEDQIREWMRNNPPPEPGSIRAHNEAVQWDAVAPDIKAADFRSGYDMGKSIVMGGAGRPASWFGEGGKAYQTEAEQFGQVPIADLDGRSQMYRCILEDIANFVIDQAVLHGRLSAEKAAAGINVTMPEVSKKDLARMVNGVPQLASALAIAQQNRWITPDEATRLWAYVIDHMGYEIDAQAMIDAAAAAPPVAETDYEALLGGGIERR